MRIRFEPLDRYLDSVYRGLALTNWALITGLNQQPTSTCVAVPWPRRGKRYVAVRADALYELFRSG